MVTISHAPQFDEVVLAADMVADCHKRLSGRRDLEQTDAKTLQAAVDAVSSLGLKTTHYEGLEDLGRNASKQ